MIVHIIEAFYRFLWGDLFTLKFGAFSMGIPLLVLLLIPTGIYFTFRTNFVSVRLFPDMCAHYQKRKERTAVCHRCRPFLYLLLPGLVWEIW